MVRKPRYLADQSNRDRWMISYTDVVTILLILFVAAAARGTQPAKPPAPVQPPAATPVHPAPAAGLLRTRQLLEARGIQPRLDQRGLVIDLPQKVLFNSGDDRINAGALPTIDAIAGILSVIPNKVMLVGHADPLPIHNGRFRDNWELSAARSIELLDVLKSQYGIPELRLSVASYGSWSPRSPNDTETGRAENRRVEIVILDEAAGQGLSKLRAC